MTRYARRLQQIGSSILVSLPSVWIKNNNLKKGSIVPVHINRDNSISIFASEDDTADKMKELVIPYPSVSMDMLVNQVYGGYLLGYDMIWIKASSQISFEDADRIKKAMRKLVGLEIVDEDGFHISAQFLLDADTLDAEKILRRMNAIVAGMYRDILEAIKLNKNRSESNVVVKMYDKFTEIINFIKSSADSKNLESTVAVLNLTYSMDKIARCWIDVADLVKPMHLTAPLKNA